MKEGIHPTYQRITTVCASCNNEIEVGSTQESIEIDTCYKCHSFYTGESNFVGKAGRAEKFKERMEAAAAKQQSAPQKETAKDVKVDVTKMSLSDLAAAVKGKPERGMMKTGSEDEADGSEVKTIKKAKAEKAESEEVEVPAEEETAGEE